MVMPQQPFAEPYLEEEMEIEEPMMGPPVPQAPMMGDLAGMAGKIDNIMADPEKRGPFLQGLMQLINEFS